MTKVPRRLGLALMLACTGVGAAWAQGAPGNGNVALPGSAGQPASGSSQTCVQAQIGNEKPSPYDCLNQQMQQQVRGTNAGPPSLPLSATSPSNQVGTFNEQGVKEQYGPNFGKSVIPYRPPTPVFSNGLHP